MSAAPTFTENSMTSVDRLAQARMTRAKADLKPISDAVERLVSAIGAYSQSAAGRAEQRVLLAMLAAVGDTSGEEPPVAEYDAPDAIELLDAMEVLRQLLTRPAPPESQSVIAAAPETPSPPPASTPPEKPHVLRLTPSLPLTIQPETERLAQSTIAAITHLTANWEKEPKVRLTHLLGALAAEMRICLQGTPREHPLRTQLEELPRTILAVRDNAGLAEYVHGLSAHSAKSNEPWGRRAREHRNAIARFDHDLDAPAPSTADPKRVAHKARNGTATLGDAIGGALSQIAVVEKRWPLLRASAEGRSVLLVGGTTLYERGTTLSTRTNIPVEWLQIDHKTRQVDRIAARIMNGGAAGCLIVEGFMTHSTSNRIEEACRSSGVPFAFCDRAGTASVEQAFDSIEQKLAK